jgi:hypothetical protein
MIKHWFGFRSHRLMAYRRSGRRRMAEVVPEDNHAS